jgi:predicted RNA-binding protein with PIN domain
MDQEILAAREQLIDAIGRLSYRKKFRCTLVFDGVKPTSHITPPAHSPVHVVYSSPLSADAKIRSMIEQSQGRPQLVIVTSDRNILAFARACSCKSHTSKYFVSMLYESDDAGEEKEQSTLSRKEIEEWLKLFGGK